MADLRISELATLAGANLSAGDFLPIADVSAGETKKITVTDLVGNATTLIADATIPSAKILFGSNTIPGASLTNTSVTATQLANDAVTAAKLADESSVDLVTTLPGSGAFVGQLALDTDDSKIYCWDGSSWVSIKAAGSVNAVLGSTAGVINIVATTVGDQVTISATLDNTSAAAEFLAGPTAAAGAVGYRPIVGADLPTATTTTKGAVVVNGNGLTLAGDTISINNTVTAETTNYNLVQYDAKGLVTGGRLINSSDLPIATALANGIVKPGTGLGVTAGGAVNHTNVVAPATGTKVSFDSEGHVTGTQALVETDIPALPASKITSGTLDNGRIGTNTIIGSKLANFSVTKIGNTLPTAEHIGQFFFNPLTKDLALWDGNVYQPVGITAGEIIFAGTYNASTNLVDSVTTDGTAAGFIVGNALPAASSNNNRYYVVVSQLGTGAAPAPMMTLEPPDILLSNGATYILVETSQTIAAQTATSVAFTPTGTISSANVQAAVVEVAAEALQKSGDTMVGQLLIGPAGSLVFEGATDNAFETTLGVVDPTADRTINLPNVSGTVVTTGDTGTVTSTMILDGTILNADVNTAAAIAGTKISPDFGSQNVSTTGVVNAAVGTDAAPGYTFTGRTNTGIYSPGTDQVAVTTGGTLRLLIDSNGQIEAGSLGTAAAPVFSFAADMNTGIYSPSADQLAFSTNGTGRVFIDSTGRVGINHAAPNEALEVVGNIGLSGADRSVVNTTNFALTFGTNNIERARIDTSGRLLLGTSTATNNANRQAGKVLAVVDSGTTNFPTIAITSYAGASPSTCGVIDLQRSGGATDGSLTAVNNADALGFINFLGSTNGSFIRAATIHSEVDKGIVTTSSMPGCLVLSTTNSGSTSPTEKFRITADGSTLYFQAAPASVSAGAIIAASSLLNGLLNFTGAAGNLTLPTGSNTEAALSNPYTNIAFDWSVINTGAGTATLGGATGHTIVGNTTTASNTSSRWVTRRTGVNTYVSYRIS